MQRGHRTLPPAIDFMRLCQGRESGLRAVIQQYGAFKLRNHGVSLSTKDGCFAFSKSFFGQSSDLKIANPAFSRFEGEKVKGTRIPKESLYICKPDLCEYPTLQKLSKEFERITPVLLREISRVLNLSPPLDSFHTGGSDQLALHHYPEVPGARERSPAHRDWGLLTLLMHEDMGSQNGLEVAELPCSHQGGQPANNSKFISVVPGNDEITVLLGNMLPRLSKLYQWEEIRSCAHRVSGFGERYSIACFVHADDNMLLHEDGTTAREHREKWETQSKVGAQRVSNT
ncbi:hypothetical protein ASPBRDRAFT_538804 [Aspergillus brasiliensis CBS 101740]|uniref:Fe2OG dioxygenase domain-containing protein n=1 Tax=Aspergillus brasiliensis (strain CBS 101740 / IMI 381727 / IBT 21946) TaxID=767769 RepID=A0A1L9UL86_ASPBC|nr:hypothetical protein ASPBRDRAFT_538804 [Aspergillus brasiliensis CBS 101740]